MAIFEKTVKKIEEEKQPEWIWVDGYKGTDADMKCHGYRYELGKTHNMPEDAEIKMCEKGFHLCLNLKDVFRYYSIGNGRRYFKVRALVRTEDFTMYGTEKAPNPLTWSSERNDKLVAKSIEFVEELTADEIFENCEGYKNWTREFKEMALKESPAFVESRIRVLDLEALGYTEELAIWFESEGLYLVAMGLGKQPGLSWEFRIDRLLDFITTSRYIAGDRSRGRRRDGEGVGIRPFTI